MKKIFTCFLVAALMMMSGINTSSAMTYDESYEKIKNYYENKELLESVDHILTCESLGVESDDKHLDDDIFSTDYTSNIAKSIIAMVLHNDDPRNYKGVNYIELLENRVHNDGAVYLDGEYNFDANYQVYSVYALYAIGSSKLDLAADYLSTMAMDNGAFGFTYGVRYEDVATTGWVIDALSLINKEKYNSVIQKAIDYIQSTQNSEAKYDPFFSGGDACTQSSALLGLMSYDKEGVLSTTYNKGTFNPYKALLTFQNDDGTFWSAYNGGVGYYDDYSTVQGALAVGYYKNGSVYESAKSEYNDIVNPVTIITLNQSEVTLIEGKTVELKASVSPQTANQTIVWNIEDATIASIDDNGVVTAIKEGTTTVSVNSKNGLSAKCVIHVVKEEAKENSETLDKNKAPETSDSFHILMYVVFMFISGFVVIRRKAFGR